MALIFQRLAHNYAKAGYYPTDCETTSRIVNALSATSEGIRRGFDPCCGEGVFLAECNHALGMDRSESYGVEFDEERAWHAKELLGHVIHSDINDAVIGMKQFGLLLLNPPYGDTVADKANVESKRDRLEVMFYRRTVGVLQDKGILVYIIPQYSLNKYLANSLCRMFDRIVCYQAPEQRFKQIVILGVRRTMSAIDRKKVKYLIDIGKGDVAADVFPELWTDAGYEVPVITDQTTKFYSARLDSRQLANVVKNNPCLWKRWPELFHYGARPHRRPLCDMSRWHMALMLAAGQVTGIVNSKDGRIYIIKGSTYKSKADKQELKYDEDDNLCETKIIRTDKFVPTIRAIDVTPGSEQYGCCLTIR